LIDQYKKEFRYIK